MQIGSAVTPKPGSQEGTFKTVHSMPKGLIAPNRQAKTTCALVHCRCQAERSARDGGAEVQRVGVMRTRLLGTAKEVEMWEYKLAWDRGCRRELRRRTRQIQKCKLEQAGGGTRWLHLTLAC